MTEPKAVIFNIQKYSIGDGPGIRTTVFFKGCPLRCLWCHNPEGLYKEIEVGWHMKDCVKCLACIQACPQKAISLKEDRILTDRAACNACGKCVESCAFGAREMIGECMTLGQVLDEVMTDRLFYQFSGGGVTCSGGEALMQADFVTALFKALKERDIHTTLDTSGFGGWPEFCRVLQYTDLVLFDLKHMDREAHLRLTGQEVEPIHKNFERLARMDIPVFVRVPLIPGYNDDEENIEATAAYAAGFPNVKKVELLPYHSFGEPKYAMFNERYELSGLGTVEEAQMIKLKKIVGRYTSTE
jgi:pyruvate formate lyase activating enzyme